MEKKKITVFVAGQKLNLITTDSEKYVSDIASKVDTAINSLFSASNMSREKCAVMAALDFCDDEAKARAALAEIKEQIKDYIEDSANLREENATLKSEVEKLTNELNELKASKKTLIASSVEIKKEKKQETVEEIEIDADDDLSFDFDEKDTVIETEENKAEKEVQECAVEDKKPVYAPAPKSDKKRHNHSHVNPYKERFIKQQAEQKGYTPVRQYSLFDKLDDDE